MMMSQTSCKLPVDGILLVNKPQGLTSNAVLQKVKRLYQAKKAGHTGSLDPMATGMLPICFGEATKLCQYLLDADKFYQATGLLGAKTNTGDAMGEVISTAGDFIITEDQLNAALSQFLGPIQQIPSMFSALKHQGTPLYKLAREGITIERQARDISIHQLDLLHFDGKQFVINVSCSKGTYIRNLVEDIGEVLGVYAHVTQLHRLYTTGFADEVMHSLDELTVMDMPNRLQCLLPLERAIDYMPVLQVDMASLKSLKYGQTVINPKFFSVDGCVRLHDPNGRFFGLGDVSADGVLKARRLLAF